MPEQFTVVETHLGVDRLDLARIRRDERIDLDHRRTARRKRGI